MPVSHARRRATALLVLSASLSVATESRAAPAAVPADIDRVVTRTMAAFNVPGIAVGVVKDGKLVYAKGFGVRTAGRPEPVDADTGFGIGSNTKAFTAAALAILVDEGKLHWDDRVIDHLPDFRMADPWVTREFTVRDLLTHRSGLGLGAGDLMFVTKTDFTRAELIRALRHLKPVTSFRSEFAYDNLMYAVAGEVVAVVSGQSWEDFVATRVLAKLGMDRCAVTPARIKDPNQASPHVLLGATPKPVPLLEIGAVSPAGSIVCGVNGMARWVETQLAHGAIPGDGQLFSAAQGAEMWTPQTILRTGGPRDAMTRTHFRAYGLGWALEDYRGYKRVFHNGGLPGMVTHVSLVPELGLGVLVLTNQQEDAALGTIALSIIDRYAAAPAQDWVAFAQAEAKKRAEQVAAADAARAPPRPKQPVDPATLGAYAGRYVDAWRGEANIAKDGERLRLTFSRTDALTGPLEPISPRLFIVHWDDRTLDADAYVRFEEDFAGKVTGFRMQAVSDTTDFSFDFQDVDFRRAP